MHADTMVSGVKGTIHPIFGGLADVTRLKSALRIKSPSRYMFILLVNYPVSIV